MPNWTSFSGVLGGAVWLVWLAAVRPDPFQTEWAIGILLLAALVLVPAGTRLLRERTDLPLTAWLDWLTLPAGLSLLVSTQLSAGAVAGTLAFPWLLVTLAVGVAGLRRLVANSWTVPILCHAVACLFLIVGGGWTVLTRFGLRPLGFEDVIVLLTAIHFHYAGFVLPLLLGFAVERRPDALGKLAALAVLVGVPAVAVGITSTQVGGPPLLETVCACALAAAAACAGVVLVRDRWQHTARGVARPGGLLSATALLLAMTFAAAYGLRHAGLFPSLDVPWMRVLHGTTVAFGFALPGLLAELWSGCESSAGAHRSPPAAGVHGEPASNGSSTSGASARSSRT